MKGGLCTCACYNNKPSNYDRLIAALINIRDFKPDCRDDFSIQMSQYIENIIDTIDEVEDLL